jgi:hypothetical protein
MQETVAESLFEDFILDPIHSLTGVVPQGSELL